MKLCDPFEPTSMPPPSASKASDTAAKTASDAVSDVIFEAKSASASDEIFLSPHVVDANEFDDFAQRLRSLILQADQTAQSLRSAAASAQSTRTELNSSALEQTKRLKAAAKVLRAIAAVEAKIGLAPKEQTVVSVTHEEPAADEQATGRAMVDQLIARAQRQLAVSMDSAAQEIDRRVQIATDAIDAKQLELDTRMTALERKEDAIEQSLAGAHGESTSLGDQGRALAALHDRVREALETLDERLTASAPPAISHDADVDHAVNHATESTAQCVEITQDLASLLEQAAEIRTEIVESISESDRLLDEIKARRKKLAAMVRDTLIACDKAESSMSETKKAAEIRAENQSAKTSEVGSPTASAASTSRRSVKTNSPSSLR